MNKFEYKSTEITSDITDQYGNVGKWSDFDFSTVCQEIIDLADGEEVGPHNIEKLSFALWGARFFPENEKKGKTNAEIVARAKEIRKEVKVCDHEHSETQKVVRNKNGKKVNKSRKHKKGKKAKKTKGQDEVTRGDQEQK